MKDPHQNIFFYYRGQQSKKEKIDYQIENNVTKAFINLLEFSSPQIRNKILNSLGYSSAKIPVFNLQVCGDNSIPDALIEYEKTRIIIESKVQAQLTALLQLKGKK